jgi:hypothetical protein
VEPRNRSHAGAVGTSSGAVDCCERTTSMRIWLEAFTPVQLCLDTVASIRAKVANEHGVRRGTKSSQLYTVVQEYDRLLAALDEQLPVMAALDAVGPMGPALPAALSEMLQSARAAAGVAARQAERTAKLVSLRAQTVAERAQAAVAAPQLAAVERAALRKKKRKL